MSWLELIWVCAIPVAFVFGLFLAFYKNDPAFFLLSLVCMICLTGVFAISSGEKRYATQDVEMVPISAVLTKDRLDVITDEHELISFNKYQDVEMWKNGGTFVKRYFFVRDRFGPDRGEKEVLIIEGKRTAEEVW